MVKAEVDTRVNKAIEDAQEKYNLNKKDATLYVLRIGTHAYENSNCRVWESDDGFRVGE